MKTNKPKSRRDFLSALALGTAASGLSLVGNNLNAAIPNFKDLDQGDADKWINGIKGTNRITLDGSMPHDGFPMIWTWAFYESHNETGSPDSDTTVVCVLRHKAIPFAFKDSMWKKYPLGKIFEIKDNKTQVDSKRNLYYEPAPGDFPLPQIQGMKKMQERGAMFCVCNLATKVYSGAIAAAMNIDPDEVYADLVANILPNFQLVPSGLWALGKAQAKGCGYIYAGG
ncbi:MAG: twin-arginine translocation signal domain-containing protein [Flavobacteriaceae bacterium]|nr:twin-arginine translocation signal domain-containing protein [Flavobacteriaceae bacterium]